MIRIPQMLLIGSAGRRAGKTRFACDLLRRLRASASVAAVKIATVEDDRSGRAFSEPPPSAVVARGPDFVLARELDHASEKDTAKLLAAGADPVFWLLARDSGLAPGILSAIERIPPGALILCESNSVRRVLEPGLFFMLQRAGDPDWKPSALAVKPEADRIVIFDGREFIPSPAGIGVSSARWTLEEDATAVILAGGRSSRMGVDKSLLPIGGRPLIEHIFLQLAPNFSEVIISSNEPGKYAFLAARCVPDAAPGQGPLAGLVAALEAASHALGFVVACDVPDINFPLVRKMLRAAAGCDCAVPCSAGSNYEPLFAVYSKRALGTLRDLLARGRLRLTDAVLQCSPALVEVEPGVIFNLNTIEDYEQYIRSRNDTL